MRRIMITRPWSVRFAAMLVALSFGSVQLSAQTATEYTDKDKAKLAAIAQRPDVQKKIADTWDNRRREDMEYAFNINQSAKLGELSGTALAEFRSKYGELYNNPILLRYVNSLGQKNRSLRVTQPVLLPPAARSRPESGSAVHRNHLCLHWLGRAAGRRSATRLRAGP